MRAGHLGRGVGEGSWERLEAAVLLTGEADLRCLPCLADKVTCG